MTVGSISDLRRAAHQTFGVEFAVDVVRILAVIGIHLAADGTLQPMVIAFMAPHGVVFILMVGAIDGGLYLCAAGFTDAVGRNMPLLIKGSTAMDTRQPVIDVVMLPAVGIVRITNAVAFNALEHHAGLTAHAARSPILGVAHVGVVRMIVFRLAVGALTPASILIPVPGVIIPVVVSITFNAGGAASIAGASGTIQPVLPVVALLTTIFTDVPVVGVVMLPRILPIIHSMGCCMNCDVRPAAIRANAGSVRTHGMMATLVSYCVTVLAGQPVPLNVRAPVVPVPIVVGLAFNAGRAALTASAGGAVQPVNGIIPGRSTILTLDPVFSLVGLPIVPVPFVVDLTRNASFTAGTACTGRAVQIVSTDINLLLAFYANMPMVDTVMLPVIPTINEMSGLHCQAGFSAGIASIWILTGHPMGTIIDGFRTILTRLPMAIVILVPGFPVPIVFDLARNVSSTALATDAGSTVQPVDGVILSRRTILTVNPVFSFIGFPIVPVPIVFDLASDATGATVTAGTGLAVQPVSPDIELFTAFIADTPVIGAIMRHVIPVVDSVFYFFSGVAGRAADTAQAIHTADVVIAVIDLLTTFIADMPVIDAVRFPGVLPVVHKMRHSTTDRDARLAAHFTGGFVSSAAVGGMVRLIDRFRAVNTFGPVAFLIVEESVKVIRMTFIDGHARLATLSADSFVSSITLGIMLSVVYLFIAVFALIPMMGTIVALGIHIPVMGSIACNARSVTGDTDTRRAAIDIVQFVIVVLPAGAAFIPVLRIIGAKRPIGMIDLGFRHIGGAAHKAFRRILTGDDVHIVCIIEVLHTAVLAHRVVNISTLHSIAVAPGGIVVLCTLRARLFRQCHA